MTQLQPLLTYRRYTQLLKGGLPSSSIPQGSRNSSHPLPHLDHTDQQLIHYWTLYTQAIQQHQLTRALRIQGWFLNKPDPIPDTRCQDPHCTNLLALGRHTGYCTRTASSTSGTTRGDS